MRRDIVRNGQPAKGDNSGPLLRGEIRREEDHRKEEPADEGRNPHH
jgi:hypothetical protein